MNNGYRWLTEYSQQFLEKDYLVRKQTVDERVDVIFNTAENILGIKGFAKKIKEYFKKGWFSLSTPIWTNFGNNRGLPISCFGSYIDDTMKGIIDTHGEVSMMTKGGGGTSAFFGELRCRGSEIKDNGDSGGPVHFMQMFDTLINVIGQGKTRRGNFAAYLNIDHPDVMEHLSIRSDGHPIQDLSFGICVPDYWLKEMKAGDIEKRKIWAKVIERRIETGYPYIFFTDNANNGTVDVYKDKNLKITHSNLCTEIFLPDSIDESFVCDLSSANILYYDEWKDTDMIEMLAFLLDAVMTEFINKAKDMPYMERAVRFAERHRALGIGVLGWHSYLQSKMIPFESMQAKALNIQISKNIKEKSWEASRKLAELFGEPELLKGYGRRNTTLTAIAPTKSSAFILGQVSEGVEPNRTNYYIKDLQKGKFTVKNPYLEKLLESKGINTDEKWLDILKHGGSVQHVDYLTKHEKDVFKTFGEISPKEILIQAAARQKHIDQGQSINLMIHKDVPTKDINALMLFAWEEGIKSLYYQIGVNEAQQFARDVLVCSSCEG